MTEEKKDDLKWYEVTWTLTEGRSLVKAASSEEAKKLASDYCSKAEQDGPQKLADGRIVSHEWYDTSAADPYISDVEQDTASDVEGQDIEDNLEPEEGG